MPDPTFAVLFPRAAVALVAAHAAAALAAALLLGAQGGRHAFWGEVVGRDGGAANRRWTAQAVASALTFALVGFGAGPSLGWDAGVGAVALGGLHFLAVGAVWGATDALLGRFVFEVDRVRGPLPAGPPPVSAVVGRLLGGRLAAQFGGRLGS